MFNSYTATVPRWRHRTQHNVAIPDGPMRSRTSFAKYDSRRRAVVELASNGGKCRCLRDLDQQLPHLFPAFWTLDRKFQAAECLSPGPRNRRSVLQLLMPCLPPHSRQNLRAVQSSTPSGPIGSYLAPNAPLVTPRIKL